VGCSPGDRDTEPAASRKADGRLVDKHYELCSIAVLFVSTV